MVLGKIPLTISYLHQFQNFDENSKIKQCPQSESLTVQVCDFSVKILKLLMARSIMHILYQSINQGVIAQFYILVGARNLTLEFRDQNAINPKALYGTTKVCY